MIFLWLDLTKSAPGQSPSALTDSKLDKEGRKDDEGESVRNTLPFILLLTSLSLSLSLYVGMSDGHSRNRRPKHVQISLKSILGPTL